MQSVKARDFRNRAGHWLEAALSSPVRILRRHKPAAVLLSEAEYRRLAAYEDAYWARAADQAHERGYVGKVESEKLIDDIMNVNT